ncbi:MAG: AtpZ/AtpI family protein [Planctomycetota bacterium]|jgi:ATP synthase protein I
MSARDRDDELDDELEDEFEYRIKRQCARIEKGRHGQGDAFWQYLGLIGVVGWSVVLPMVVGLFVGRWIDRRYETGYAWTIGLLLFGLFMGCLNAWRSITKEH